MLTIHQSNSELIRFCFKNILSLDYTPGYYVLALLDCVKILTDQGVIQTITTGDNLQGVLSVAFDTLKIATIGNDIGSVQLYT